MGLELVATGLFASATGIPQYFEQKKAARGAARAQEEANRVSRASAQVENARRRRQALAQARLANAQNIAAQGSQVQTSSQLSGVQAALGSQFGANIGAQQQQIGAQQNIQNLQQRQADILRSGQERVGLYNVGANIANLIATAGTSAAGGPAGNTGGLPNMQGQSSALYNNSAFVSRY